MSESDRPEQTAPLSRPKFTEAVPIGPDGQRHCPKCQGTQFETSISTARKVMFGFASMLGGKNVVSCVTCGEKFTRG